MTTSQPAQDYAEAATRAAALQARDGDDINPKCRTRLLSHDRQTPWAIVFWHGYTNCPQQWARYAEPWHARGFNVLIPRLPGHGAQDRFCDMLGDFGAADMCAAADESLDIARGLGERVAVVGLSLSGALALRAAQTRADLALAVPIAPQIAPRGVPAALISPLLALARALPRFFVWWDLKEKAAMVGPPHAYPRFPSRGIAEMFGVGQDALAAARRPGAQPRAQAVVLVTNAYDPALDNRPAHEIAARWQANGTARVTTYEFDASLKLIHDIVDPDQADQHVDIVYPVLDELITRAMAA